MTMTPEELAAIRETLSIFPQSYTAVRLLAEVDHLRAALQQEQCKEKPWVIVGNKTVDIDSPEAIEEWARMRQELQQAQAREDGYRGALGMWKALAHFMSTPTDWRTGESLAIMTERCIQAGEQALTAGEGGAIRKDGDQPIPDGYREIEAYSNGAEIVVIGRVHRDDEDHNCDAMGCSSVGGHVVYRGTVNLLMPVGEGGTGDA